MKLYVEVVFPLPLDQRFLYTVPEVWTDKARIGARVLTTFHNRTLTGFIVGLKKRRPATPHMFKDIIEVLDEEPIFSPSFLSFTQELSGYYYSSWGELLQSSLPSTYVLKSKTKVSIADEGRKALEGTDLRPEEKRLLNGLLKRQYSLRFIERLTGLRNVSSWLARLESRGLVHIEKDIPRLTPKREELPAAEPTQLEMDFSLDDRLYQVSRNVSSLLGTDVFSPFFLCGPRERREAVYFYLMKVNLALKKSTLFFVPEISLTETFKDKFVKRFGEGAALIHSQMTQRQKEVEWRRVKDGRVRVVVGPRSAVLSPLENIGLIIVDEEQDESYYQKESPSYDARQGARLKARQEKAVLLYGSSTPSVEGFFRAEHEKHLVHLESEAPSFRVEMVESRPGDRMIHPRVQRRIKERLEQNIPIVVFYNRRGYAPFLLCSRCSAVPRCVHCDIGLTYHKGEQKLTCHYCNYSVTKFDRCRQCGDRIILGRSLGIEAIEEELRKLFPQNRIAGFNLDVVKSRREQDKIIKRFADGKIDILVGTQLLVHRRDMPPVSTVVSLFPETTLSLSDFRASQRTFQNLFQMMSFLERDEKSEFLIQTSFSPHYSIRAAAEKDYLSFYGQEMTSRRVMKYPPFGCMVEILFYGENLRVLARSSREFLASVQKQTDRIEVLGPALAPVSRVRGQNRIQVVLKSKRKSNLDRVLAGCLRQIKTRKSVYVYE